MLAQGSNAPHSLARLDGLCRLIYCLEYHVQALVAIAGGVSAGHDDHEFIAAGGIGYLHAAVSACCIGELIVQPLLLQTASNGGIKAVDVHDLLARGGRGDSALVDLIEAHQLPTGRAVVIDVEDRCLAALQRLV